MMIAGVKYVHLRLYLDSFHTIQQTLYSRELANCVVSENAFVCHLLTFHIYYFLWT
jgi:hypothetical protein